MGGLMDEPRLASAAPQTGDDEVPGIADALFVEKDREVVGLSLSSPERALALCVGRLSKFEELKQPCS
jgi:hypothetical protein